MKRIKYLIYKNKHITNRFEITTILKDNGHSWLELCEIENAIIELLDDKFIWRAGTFYFGEWKGDIWLSGKFRFGKWLKGVFWSGIFYSGDFITGVIKGGEFKGNMLGGRKDIM